VNLTVTLADADEPSSSYMLELFHEIVGDGELAIAIEESDPIQSGGSWTFNVELTDPRNQAFLIHVKQQNSADDGWTGPIWFDPAVTTTDGDHQPPVTPSPVTPVTFMGSRNSDVYHFPDCSVVRQILPANLVTYASEPAGKRLHRNCPQHEHE